MDGGPHRADRRTGRRRGPRYVAPAVAARFYALFHLFVFTMLLAVTTDDVGFMWVAVEGTTLASVFLVNFERTRALAGGVV